MISVPPLGIHNPVHRQTKNSLAEPTSLGFHQGMLASRCWIHVQSVNFDFWEDALAEDRDKNTVIYKEKSDVYVCIGVHMHVLF